VVCASLGASLANSKHGGEPIGVLRHTDEGGVRIAVAALI
jgi:hypothetical protein